MPNSSLIFAVAVVAGACSLLACSKNEAPPPAATPALAASSVTPVASAPASAPVAAWAGRWTGPEGTYLEITGSGPEVQLTIRNLDGPRNFTGQASGEAIGFERDGVKETIRAGSGPQTGMKWLQEKTDCLVVKMGEGYCR